MFLWGVTSGCLKGAGVFQIRPPEVETSLTITSKPFDYAVLGRLHPSWLWELGTPCYRKCCKHMKRSYTEVLHSSRAEVAAGRSTAGAAVGGSTHDGCMAMDVFHVSSPTSSQRWAETSHINSGKSCQFATDNTKIRHVW